MRDETSARMVRAIAETIVAAVPRVETRVETPVAEPPRDEMRDETPPVPQDRILYRYANEEFLAALTEAARGNFDPFANLEPMRDVIRQGCDLEQDVAPVVARLIPELPRPLKNWGAPRLVREILAARDQRLAGRPVEAPPPARRATESSGTNDPRIRTIDKGDYR
jgi:hypothetical protein